MKVIARRGRQHFKASPWELEDAEEEQIEIIENHSPKRFVIENDVLMAWNSMCSSGTKRMAGRRARSSIP